MLIQDTLKERGSRYGKFDSHAWITQELKHVMKATSKFAGFQAQSGWEKLTPSQKESLEMIAHKIGRILNGDPNYADSWVDIVGYAQLIVDELGEKK